MGEVCNKIGARSLGREEYRDAGLDKPVEKNDIGVSNELIEGFHQEAQKLYQQKDEQVQKLSWLRHGFPQNATARADFPMMALVAADGFASADAASNKTPKELLEYQLSYLRGILDDKNKLVKMNAAQRSRIQLFCDEMKECLQLIDEMADVAAVGEKKSDGERQALLQEFAAKLSDRLKQKGSLWLPIVQGDGNITLVRLDKAGKVAWIDTAASTPLCPGAPVAAQTRVNALTGKVEEDLLYQQFTSISGIKKERMAEPALFQALLEQQLLPVWKNGSKGGGDFSAHRSFMYKSLLAFLGAKVDKAENPKSHPELFKKVQKSYVSPFKSLSTAFYYSVNNLFAAKGKKDKEGRNLYKSCKFWWQMQALTQGSKALFDSPTAQYDAQKLNTIEQAASNMQRQLLKLQADGIPLASEHVEAAHATLSDILAHVGDARSRLAAVKEAAVAATAQPIDLAVDPAKAPVVKVVVDPPTADIVDDIKQNNDSSASIYGIDDLSDDQQLLLQIKEQAFPTVDDPAKAHEALEQITHALQTILNDIKNLKYGHTKEPVAEALQYRLNELVKAFPLSKSDGSGFWNQVPQEQAIACMRSLNKLMHLWYMTSQLQSKNSRSPDLSVGLYACLAAIDALARRDAATQLQGYTINWFNLLDEVRKPEFILQDPGLHDKLREILFYFDPDYRFEKGVWKPEKPEDRRDKALFIFHYQDEHNRFQLNEYTVGKTKDKTVNYFKKLLDSHPEFAERLRKEGVNQSDNELVRLAQLISQPWDKYGIIPEATHQMMQAALFSQNFNGMLSDEKSIHRNISNAECEKELSIKASVEDKSDVFGRSIPTLVFQEQIDGKNIGHFYYSDGDTSGYCLHNPLENSYVFGYNDLLSWEKYHKNKPAQNSAMMKAKSHIDGLDTDEYRQLLSIGNDPYDEANRAIAFAKAHVALLKKVEVRKALRMHLLRPDRIAKQMEDNPAFLNTVATFFKDTIENYRQLGDSSTALDLADLGEEIKQFLLKSGFEVDAFPNFRTVILDAILPVAENDAQKLACYRTALLLNRYCSLKAFEDGEKKRTMAQDVVSLNVAKARYDSGEYNAETTDAEQNAGALKKILRPYFEQELHDDEVFRNAILNAAIRVVDPLAVEQTFEIKQNTIGYDFFESDEYRCNPFNGDLVKKDGTQFAKLPYWVAEHPLFKVICPGEITRTTKINYKTYEIEPHGVTVVNKIGRSPTFIKNIEGKRCYLEEKITPALTQAAPALFDSKEANPLVWVDIDDRNNAFVEVKNKQLYRLFLKGEEKNSVGVGLGGEPLFFNFGGEEKTIEGLVRLSDDKAFVPFSMASPSLHFLKRFGDENSIRCWTKSDTIDEIALDQVSLNFRVVDVNGEKRALCQQFPGYWLSDKQACTTLGANVKALYLENGAGKRKVLIDKNAVMREASPSTSKENWIEVEERKGQLHGETIEAKLFLALLHSHQGDFLRVYDELKECRSFARYTINEEALLEKLIMSLAAAGNSQATALMAKVYIQKEENNLKYPLSVNVTQDKKNDDATMLLAMYGNYLTGRGNAGPLALSMDEEHLFLLSIHRAAEKVLEEAKKAEGKKEKETWRQSLERATAKIKGKIFALTVKKQIERRWEYLQGGKAKLGCRTVDQPQQLPDLGGGSDDAVTAESLIFKFIGFSPDAKSAATFLTSNSGDHFEKEFFPYYKRAREGSKKEREELLKQLKLHTHLSSNKAYITILTKVCQRPNRYPTTAALKKATDDLNAVRVKLNACKPSETRKIDNEKRKKEAYRNRLFKKIVDAANTSLWSKICTYARLVFKYVIGAIFHSVNKVAINRRQQKAAVAPGKKGKKKVEGKAKALVWPGKTLKDIDTAFNGYFDGLLKKYFAAQEKKVDIGGEELPVNHSDVNVSAKLKRENEELKKYREMLQEKKGVEYTFHSSTDIAALKSDLESQINRWKGSLKVQKRSILWRANHAVEAEKRLRERDGVKKGKGKKAPERLLPALSRITISDLQKVFHAVDASLLQQ